MSLTLTLPLDVPVRPVDVKGLILKWKLHFSSVHLPIRSLFLGSIVIFLQIFTLFQLSFVEIFFIEFFICDCGSFCHWFSSLELIFL